MTCTTGLFLLKTMQTLNEPATYEEIVNLVGDKGGVLPSDIKKDIWETLKGGVRHGYIVREDKKYSAVPIFLPAIVEEVLNNQTAMGEAEFGKDGEENKENQKIECKEGRAPVRRRRRVRHFDWW